MLGGSDMLCTEKIVTKMIYEIDGHLIVLDKEIVERYASVVCPISEQLLRSLIIVLGNECNDTILSAKIETDMEQELCEYGV